MRIFIAASPSSSQSASCAHTTASSPGQLRQLLTTREASAQWGYSNAPCKRSGWMLLQLLISYSFAHILEEGWEKVGETTSFWKQHALRALHTDSLCFHIISSLSYRIGTTQGVSRLCLLPCSPTPPPMAPGHKKPFVYKVFVCRIIIYRALHFLLMKHNLTTSLTNT